MIAREAEAQAEADQYADLPARNAEDIREA